MFDLNVVVGARDAQAGRGFQRGDALALASGNSADFLASFLNCTAFGAKSPTPN